MKTYGVWFEGDDPIYPDTVRAPSARAAAEAFADDFGMEDGQTVKVWTREVSSDPARDVAFNVTARCEWKITAVEA